MSKQSNKQGEYFADIVHKFMKNEVRYTDGCDARAVNMFIYKEDGVITIKNPTSRVAMIITPQDDDFIFQMRFVNATTYSRIMAVKELLGWDGFNVVFEGGIPFLIAQGGKRITLNSGLLYSKTELEEMSDADLAPTQPTAQ